MQSEQPPTFLINLDRSADRLARMRAEASEYGFAFERFRGVDGAKDVPKWLSEQFALDSAMSNGEIGCYASHLSIWRLVSDRGLEYAIVLEDDAEARGDFVEVALSAIKATPAGWDIIHLSTNFKRPCYPLAPLGGGRSLVRYARLPANTAAYIISRAGCAKLLAPSARTRPVDMEFRYAWLRNLEVYGVCPALVGEHSRIPSTVQAAWRQSGNERRRGRSSIQSAWKPSVRSQIDGWFFVKQRLGLRGTLYVWARRMLDLVSSQQAQRRATTE